VSKGGRYRGWEKILSGLHAEHGAQRRAQSHSLEIMTSAKTKSQTLNWLSHPGTPNWLNFNIAVLREARREREMDEWLLSGAEHTQHLSIKFTILYRHSSWWPKTIRVVTSKMTEHDHRNTYDNNEKVGNTVRITKMWCRDTKWASDVWKTEPQTFNLWKTQYLWSAIKWYMPVFEEIRWFSLQLKTL